MSKKSSPLNRIPEKSRPAPNLRSSTQITYYAFGEGGQRCVVGIGTNGTVFVPAAVFPDGGLSALRKAVDEDVAGGTHDGHAFLPAPWALAELQAIPERCTIIRNMCQAVRKAAGLPPISF